MQPKSFLDRIVPPHPFMPDKIATTDQILLVSAYRENQKLRFWLAATNSVAFLIILVLVYFVAK
jgi:hypothetical protein